MVVLINSSAGLRTSGSRHMQAAVAHAFASTGVNPEIRLFDGQQLATAAVELARQGPDAIIAAGGDGTVSAVAAALVATEVPLGVLPTGTLNHFARDLGIPADLAAAARIIAARRVRRIDVGQVNGRCFINNASIGLYPQIVVHRDEIRQRLGRGKWVAMAMAAISVFRRYPLVRVVLEANGRSFPRMTPFVFVGNNRYDMNLLAMGARFRLDGGELGVYFANRTGRFGLLRLMLRALLGRLNQARDFDMLSARHVRIETGKKALRVALDGEVHELLPPLEYRVLPGALTVIAP